MPMLDDDRLITKALLRRFAAEGEILKGDGRHYAFIRRDNGEITTHNPYSPEIIGEQTMFAVDVLNKLNRELHHNGAWVIVFTDPKPADMQNGLAVLARSGEAEYSRYVILWLDEDGDVQIPIEWVENECEPRDFAGVLATGLENIIGLCEGGWELWNLHMRKVLEPGQGELYKRARGQLPPSLRN